MPTAQDPGKNDWVGVYYTEPDNPIRLTSTYAKMFRMLFHAQQSTTTVEWFSACEGGNNFKIGKFLTHCRHNPVFS